LGGGDTSGGGGSFVGAGGFGVSAASRCTATVPFAAGVFGVNETVAFQWKRSFGATCDVQPTDVAQAFCSAVGGLWGSLSAGWMWKSNCFAWNCASIAACTAVARRHASDVL